MVFHTAWQPLPVIVHSVFICVTHVKRLQAEHMVSGMQIRANNVKSMTSRGVGQYHHIPVHAETGLELCTPQGNSSSAFCYSLLSRPTCFVVDQKLFTPPNQDTEYY